MTIELLHREGFTAQILTRKNAGKWKFEAKVYMWGTCRDENIDTPVRGRYLSEMRLEDALCQK